MKVLSLAVNNKGLSLIEVVAAMAIAVLIITGLVFTAGEAIKNTQFSKNQALATKYAEEGMDKIRSERDRAADWTTFKANCLTYNLGTIPATFNRTHNCEEIGGDIEKRKITVTVSWTDSSGSHQSQLTSYLSNWITR